MSTKIQLRKRGTLTLPAELRERYGIEEGDVFNLVDLDGLIVLAPLKPMVPDLAQEIERLRIEAGVSIEELLEGIKEQREKYDG